MKTCSHPGCGAPLVNGWRWDDWFCPKEGEHVALVGKSPIEIARAAMLNTGLDALQDRIMALAGTPDFMKTLEEHMAEVLIDAYQRAGK